MTKLRHEIETAAREAFGGEPEPIEARPFSARLILLCALAGLSPVAVLGAFLWWAI